ncbi:hypothetical protein ACFWPQ_46045 [Streptomyces sp. NPDC058464]|uniref:hypothetical protein n=1 Tax=Streptomyces sp. NPDC058464 TaxID=3346511 RepID=UPI0036527983
MAPLAPSQPSADPVGPPPVHTREKGDGISIEQVSGNVTINQYRGPAAPQRLEDAELFRFVESSAALQRSLSGFAEGTFLGNKIPTGVLTSLDEFVGACKADPRGFHDTDVENTYRVFLAAARGLLKSTAEGMFPMKRAVGWSEIPGEWYDEDRARWDKAEKEIMETWRGFLDAHDAFLLCGHGALLG